MGRTARNRAALALALAILPAVRAPLYADDHERVREAVREGEILPLRDILQRVRNDFAGELLEVEFEEEEDDDHGITDRRPMYEVKLLAPGGRVTELYFDARTGVLLAAHGHHLEDSGDPSEEDEREDD